MESTPAVSIGLYSGEPQGLAPLAAAIGACRPWVVKAASGNLSANSIHLQCTMPDVAVFEFTCEITRDALVALLRDNPRTSIVLFLRKNVSTVVRDALELGVKLVLRKSEPPQQWLTGLDEVLAGGCWDVVPPKLQVEVKNPPRKRRSASARPLESSGIRRPSPHSLKCLCPHCQDLAKWERIFEEKFADPYYYSGAVTHSRSPLDSA